MTDTNKRCGGMTVLDWQGPLFYPPIDAVAILGSGARVHVWPAESDDPACFTGCAIAEGRTLAQAAVHDSSCLWLRSAIVRVEAVRQ